MCAYKFDKWFRCDSVHRDKKEEYARRREQYPCLPHLYEAEFSCADNVFEFLLELAYYRQLNGISYEKFLNNELFAHATVYDNPDPQTRIKYTY